MRMIDNPDKSEWFNLHKRPTYNALEMIQQVEPICAAVKKDGDKAVKGFECRFGGRQIGSMKVAENEFDSAEKQLPAQLKEAIKNASSNIRAFHAAQKTADISIETMPGVHCWLKKTPIERVGLYVPGGSAPLFSTALMLCIPAVLAGCSTIVLCTPARKDGTVHPAILYACHSAGVSSVYRIGGSQAIAAMAYGTETIPAVFKIFGPGNQYVTAAKQYISLQGVAIDMPAGPSEVLVVADETTNPDLAAIDLLAQAEHGPDSQVILCTTSVSVCRDVIVSVGRLLKDLPRAHIASTAIENSYCVALDCRESIIDFVNQYAPEHLILSVSDPHWFADRVTNAGSVFLGAYSPESAGDYASGTNHTLPTNGYAKSYGSLTLASFMKEITFQELTRKGMETLAPAITTMADGEELRGHSLAVSMRLENKIEQENIQ